MASSIVSIGSQALQAVSNLVPFGAREVVVIPKAGIPFTPPQLQESPLERFKTDFTIATILKLREAKDRTLTEGVPSFAAYEPNCQSDGERKFVDKMRDFSEYLDREFRLDHRAEIQGNSRITEALRDRLVALTQDEFYKENARGNHPAVNYLQLCALKLEAVDGTPLVKAYGEKVMDLPDRPVDIYEFVQAVDGGRDRKESTFGKSRDSTFKTVTWAATHPAETRHILSAKNVDYRSYHNHAVFYSTPFKDGEKVLNHKQSPGLTGENSLAEKALFPAYEKLGIRWVHINNQDGHIHGSGAEFGRGQIMHEWAAKYPKVFSHALISFDTPLKTAKGLVEQFTMTDMSVQAFYQAYEEHVRQGIRDIHGGHGFCIPETLLNDRELDAAFTAARNMIYKGRLVHDREAIVRIIDRNLAQTLEWAIMRKELSRGLSNQQNDPEMRYSTLSQACKENFDRGPQENAGLKIAEKVLDVQPITRDEAAALGGTMLGRVDFSSDRAPLEKRFIPFKERMAFVHTNYIIVHDELVKLNQVLTGTEPQEERAAAADPSSVRVGKPDIDSFLSNLGDEVDVFGQDHTDDSQ